MKITATIISLNEAANISEAIKSVEWADEILVVDSESTDQTRELAEGCGARVIVNPWPGFSKQKQFAADAAGNDWILSLDADERVSQELKSSIDDCAEKIRINWPAAIASRAAPSTWAGGSAAEAGTPTINFVCSTGAAGIGETASSTNR
jgi:glycosyltransferase involved in cell wall biosynthesis